MYSYSVFYLCLQNSSAALNFLPVFCRLCCDFSYLCGISSCVFMSIPSLLLYLERFLKGPFTFTWK